MRWSSAISERVPLASAVEECAAALRAGLDGAAPELVLAFVSPHHAGAYAQLPSQIAAAFPGALLIGCSANGVIGDGREVEERGALSLTAASLPGVTLAPFHDDGGDPPSLPGAPQFLLLADPFTCDAESLAERLDTAYPDSRKVGGLASGGHFPGANSLFLGGDVRSRGAVGVALSGDVQLDTIVAQGCRPIGVPLAITRCEDNLILELGGKRPMDVVRELYQSLDEEDQGLFRRSLFLGIEMKGDQLEYHAGDFLIRNLYGMDAETGALAVGALPRPYQAVQFHLRDARTAAADLSALLDRYRAGRSAPAGALLFSCLGRGMHLYGRPDHDTDLFAARVGRVPLGGCFCNGEIGPVGGSTFVHGYTSAFGLFRGRGA
jgi:small ligand-binding sensory domain FIST